MFSLKIIIYIVVANVLPLNVSNAANGDGHSLWSCSGHRVYICTTNSFLEHAVCTFFFIGSILRKLRLLARQFSDFVVVFVCMNLWCAF